MIMISQLKCWFVHIPWANSRAKNLHKVESPGGQIHWFARFFWIMSITFHMIHKFQHFLVSTKMEGMPRYRKYRKLTLILSIIASSIYFGLTFLDYCLISDKNHQRSPSQNRITWSHLVSQPASQRCSSQSAPDQTGSRCVIVEAVEAEHCD